MTRAIVTVGVSQTRAFPKYIARFEETFLKYGELGDGGELRAWSSRFPPNSPTHVECHYAFKVHAVQAALERGHDRILWLDCSAYAVASIEPLWERLERDGHVLVEDNERLGKWCSDHSLSHFGMTRDQAMELPLLSGTCWGLDFRQERSRRYFDRLYALAKPEFFNGTHVSSSGVGPVHPRPGTEGSQMSTDERCWGHRSDEAIMSLLVPAIGMTTHAGVEFTGGNEPTKRTCIRSGYNL